MQMTTIETCVQSIVSTLAPVSDTAHVQLRKLVKALKVNLVQATVTAISETEFEVVGSLVRKATKFEAARFAAQVQWSLVDFDAKFGRVEFHRQPKDYFGNVGKFSMLVKV